LHPLCVKILEADQASLPLELTNIEVLEVETAPSEWPDFLGHLAPASTPTLIEIKMEGLV